jgi:hypothetical protein
MSRSESALLNFSEVVLWVSIKVNLADWNQRIISVRDYLGDIEDVELIVFTLLLWDQLNIPGP